MQHKYYNHLTGVYDMIIGTPQGICEPPRFNVEASIDSDCVNCFCFGQTTQCFSSDLQISKVRICQYSNYILWRSIISASPQILAMFLWAGKNYVL